MTCKRCGRDVPVQPHNPNDDWNTDNGLHLSFDGGYGEFVDTPFVADDELEHLLCHECAHELCAWLGVDPSNWHTHRGDAVPQPRDPGTGRFYDSFTYRYFSNKAVCLTCETEVVASDLIFATRSCSCGNLTVYGGRIFLGRSADNDRYVETSVAMPEEPR
jgi:hypothetical protein